MNTATLATISTMVTRWCWPALQNFARVLMSGLAAFEHSTQWLPTVAWTRQDGQAGLPHRVQRRPATRSGWR